MGIRENATEFEQKLSELQVAIHRYREKNSNASYKPAIEKALRELNRSYRYLNVRIEKSSNETLRGKFAAVRDWMKPILVVNSKKYQEKLETIDNLQMYLPDLMVELDDIKEKSFEIPDKIPMSENRLDLEEAIKDYDNGCWISSLALCRRAYEGALYSLYKLVSGTEPYEKYTCPNCKSTLREKAYFGITKLHSWAIEQGYVTERLKQWGFMQSDMGAGAAHSPLEDFKRDQELARLGSQQP